MNDDNNVFFAEIGKRIKQQRIKKGFTRDGLAGLVDISDKFIYDIEVGNKGMSVPTLYRISVELNVSADWLLSGEGHIERKNR